MKVVLKLGGFAFPREPSAEKIDAYSQIIKRFSRKGAIVVVTGGGPTARTHIQAARKLGASETFCDQIGVHVSRLNARLLLAKLGESAFPEIPESLETLLSFFTSKLIVVTGGLQPAQSTNAVAALVSEAIQADLLLNATDVDGIYDADPQKNPQAKKFEKVSVEEVMRILSNEGFRAGEYSLFDPLALRIIHRSHIPVIVVDGRNPSNVERALQGKRVGTRIFSAK